MAPTLPDMKRYLEVECPAQLAGFSGDARDSFVERVKKTARELDIDESGTIASKLQQIMHEFGIEMPKDDGSAKRPLSCISDEEDGDDDGATPLSKSRKTTKVKAEPAAPVKAEPKAEPLSEDDVGPDSDTDTEDEVEVVRVSSQQERTEAARASAVNVESVEPVAFSFGPVLKSAMDHQEMMRNWDKERIDDKVNDTPDTPGCGDLNTWLWHLVGTARIRPAGGAYRLHASGIKTQVGCPGNTGGFAPGEKMVRTRKAALDQAWSRGQDVQVQTVGGIAINPVGNPKNTDAAPIGWYHDWNYSNRSSRGGGRGGWEGCPPLVLDGDTQTKLWKPTRFRWRETKTAHGWEWSWDADLKNDDGGESAGTYLLVADQRAKQLCRTPKMFMTEMVGTATSISEGSDGRAELRELLQTDDNPSGGTNQASFSRYAKQREGRAGGGAAAAGAFGGGGGAHRGGGYVPYSGSGQTTGGDWMFR